MLNIGRCKDQEMAGVEITNRNPLIYLAGPMVFYPDSDRVFRAMKEIMSQYHLDGVAPIDNQETLKRLKPGRALGMAIYIADAELMNTVDGAIFNIDPFRRGTEMDPGTAFEVGYCAARDLPMAGWTTDERFYPKKVHDFMSDVFHLSLTETSSNVHGATSGTLRDADGMLVHSEGMFQNLMIEMAIEKGGGKVFACQDWSKAFAQACKHLRQMF
jgi:nucleoside 2-deoxyribosyltransferase